jgi:hypothetical protein
MKLSLVINSAFLSFDGILGKGKLVTNGRNEIHLVETSKES